MVMVLQTAQMVRTVQTPLLWLLNEFVVRDKLKTRSCNGRELRIMLAEGLDHHTPPSPYPFEPIPRSSFPTKKKVGHGTYKKRARPSKLPGIDNHK
jgi:hypothetical protein